MDLNYENMMKFVRDYFVAFHLYSPDPATSHRMHDYFAPDLEFIPYMAGNRRISGRDRFLRLLSSHPSSTEKLTPEEIMIDDRRKIAVVLINSELSDSVTGEVLVAKSYHVVYHLTLDENNTIKIQKIKYFEEVLPAGVLDLGDVFKRDPGMVSVLSEEQ